MTDSRGSKVVVITGASSGIGRAAALEFARHKAHVVLAARRGHALDELARECELHGARALAVTTDVTDEAAVRTLAERAETAFGPIDVWVNNAAVYALGRADEVPSEVCRRVVETNLLGTVYGSREALSRFRTRHRGVLINVASQDGKVGSPEASLYVATKHAVVGFSESLRMELLDEPEIHVSTVLPAAVDTPLYQHTANYTGRPLRPMAPVLAAQRVADTIVRLADRPKREAAVGGAARVAVALRTVAPPLGERMMARYVESGHFEDGRAEVTNGNLFEPMEGWNTVSGGWIERDRIRAEADGTSALRRVGKAAAGLGLAAVIVGVGAALWTTRRAA